MAPSAGGVAWWVYKKSPRPQAAGFETSERDETAVVRSRSVPSSLGGIERRWTFLNIPCRLLVRTSPSLSPCLQCIVRAGTGEVKSTRKRKRPAEREHFSKAKTSAFARWVSDPPRKGNIPALERGRSETRRAVHTQSYTALNTEGRPLRAAPEMMAFLATTSWAPAFSSCPCIRMFRTWRFSKKGP